MITAALIIGSMVLGSILTIAGILAFIYLTIKQ